MRFLAFSTLAGWGLVATVAAAIVLLYLLRPRRHRVVVASNLIWRQVASRRRLKSERWRWLISMLLAGAIGLSIAFALTRPEVAALGGVSKRYVLTLDNSPSMAARTRTGSSRWDQAVLRARRLIQSAGPASEFMVLDTMGQAAIAGFQGRDAALAQLDRLMPASFGAARMPLLPRDGTARTEMRLYTDGVEPLQSPGAVAVESVFEPADNVAITAFEARAELRDGTRYQALVQVFNASAVAKSIQLELSGAGGFKDERALEIAAGQSVSQVFDVTAFPGGVLRSRVRSERDAFSLDDTAYAVVTPHAARKLLLVSPGNRYLEDALKLMPAIELTVIKPSNYGDAAPADAYLFDGFVPAEPPTRPALIFGTSSRAWLGGTAVEVRKPTVTRWESTHPLAADLAWNALRIQRAALAPLEPDPDPGGADDGKIDRGASPVAVVLAKGAAEAALVSTGEVPVRWVRVGFALNDSNLPHQSGFPVFLSHALDWLNPQPKPIAHGLGTVESSWVGATVVDHDGKPVAVTATESSTVFEARRPGVYAATLAGRQQQWVVNIADPKVAEINRSRFNGAAKPAGEPAARWPVELWTVLLLGAAALLLIEWLSFGRRLTV